MTAVVTRSAASVWLVGMSLLGVACARTHAVPPFPPDATPDGAMDASRDGANDSADNDGSADDDGSVVSPTTHLPRNIIVLMGDGMGPEQVATGRYAAGGRLRLDVLAGPALSNTDSLSTMLAGGTDPPATDSAAAATGIATGVLVKDHVISRRTPEPDSEPLETVLEVCKRAGKATGLVTTSMFYDASPAAFASHQVDRYMYPEISREMLSVTQPDVIMGAGAGVFDNPGFGLHSDADAAGYFVVRDVNQLAAWDPLAHPRLLGVFEHPFEPSPNHGEAYLMTPALERTESSPDPSLATMTARAIDRLSQDPDGFFLFAEDEAFDILGHRGTLDLEWANRAYPQEAMAFDAAVAVAIDWVLAHSSFEETLIVVLADHETGGYQFDHTLGPSSGTFTRSGRHTRTPIEVYALGPGSNSIFLVHSHLDTHRLLLGLLP